MAIGQVTVPWLPGYAVGVVDDLATGSPMGKVVTGPEKSVQRASLMLLSSATCFTCGDRRRRHVGRHDGTRRETHA
jgi:hypothetical protein